MDGDHNDGINSLQDDITAHGTNERHIHTCSTTAIIIDLLNSANSLLQENNEEWFLFTRDGN